MKKKYTMEEFKKIFDNAKVKALQKLDKDFHEATKEEKIDGLSSLAFSMQNMLAMVELEKEIFGQGDE